MTTDPRPYLDDVVLGLSTYNLTVTAREVSDTPVRSARFTVTRRDAQLVLDWTEETGWWASLDGQPAVPLLDSVLPYSGTLGMAALDMVDHRAPHRAPVPSYRRAGDSDDFEAQLEARCPKPKPETTIDPRLDRLDALLDTLLTAYTQAADGGPLPTPADAQQTAADVRAALADVHTMREELSRARYLSAGNAWEAGQRAGRRAANRRY
ncbi:hypothetical protein ACIRQY_30975 [Streptomyces sp. NPDC101490]|uniref:hypothetical protein n=1 Tax=Streptomyces sp. NPDC101490 TaxID=3366143 RepID=UPI00382FE36B